MSDDVQQIIYRGVELTTPFGFEAFYKAYGAGNGFEVLTKSIKDHMETCHLIQAIFHERAEAEEAYGQKLKKLGQRLSVVVKDERGTVAKSLNALAFSMSNEAHQHSEFHKLFQARVVSSLKKVFKTYESTLKNVEKQCEKSKKKLKERRSNLKALKKKCFQKQNDGKKDKLDGEFYNKSLKLESARAEFEIMTIKVLAILQSIEKLRLSELHEACVIYYNHLVNSAVLLNKSVCELESVVKVSNVNEDLLRLAIEPEGTAHKFINQPLPDFASEDMTQPLDKASRIEALSQYLSWTRKCLENETKSKFEFIKAIQGLDKSDPAESEVIETTKNQLIMSFALQDYLEACEWKFGTLIATLNNAPLPNYSHGHCIVRNHDSNNYPVSILQMPISSILQVINNRLADLFGPQGPYAPTITPGSSMQPGVSAPCGQMQVTREHYKKTSIEISLKQGDLPFVVLSWDPQWWLVAFDNEIGFVPSHCFAE